MKVLIVYPHGLGDCILATPALKAYKTSTGNFVGFAMLERFRSSELFKNNPYVDELIYTKDAWNDFPSFNKGLVAVEGHCREVAKEKGYDEVKVLRRHSKGRSKIYYCAQFLGVGLKDPHTEVYIPDEAWEQADSMTIGMGSYGFVQTVTGVPRKNLPKGFGEQWLRDHGIKEVVEVDKTYPALSIPINVGFAIMSRAAAVCLPDSVYYHACGAMDKKVDFVYFPRGNRIYNEVKPMHEVDQNIVLKI